MTSDRNEALKAVRAAREYLQRGDKHNARRMAELAASLAPDMEEPWLILAAVASPRASIAYLEEALKINPNSHRAHEGMRWANQRLSTQQQKSITSQSKKIEHLPHPAPGKLPVNRRSPLPTLLLTLSVVLVGWAALSGIASPAMAFIRTNLAAPTATDQPFWSEADIPKPTYTPTPTPTFTPTPTYTPTPTPTDTPTPTPTFTPTDTPLPTSTYAPQPTYAPPRPVNFYDGRWIDVDLSYQRVYAYKDDVLINSFLASTGTWLHPTLTGEYSIYIMERYDNMEGPPGPEYYYLPNVPYVMYYYKGYALHGTYWHSNFGVPMSHGCINLSISDAGWLFNWVSIGTVVYIHY